MYKWLVILSLYILLVLCGCKTMSEISESYEKCIKDPKCVQMVQSVNDNVKKTLPVEYGWLAGLTISTLCAFIAGRKLKKE